jgi:hypothetical protein
MFGALTGSIPKRLLCELCVTFFLPYSNRICKVYCREMLRAVGKFVSRYVGGYNIIRSIFL